jgi:hypothetical protein
LDERAFTAVGSKYFLFSPVYLGQTLSDDDAVCPVKDVWLVI